MITYEKMTKDDYNKIKELIRQAWYSDYTYPEYVTKLAYSTYFYTHLAESNYEICAKEDGEVVAFIFGRYKKPSFMKYIINKFKVQWNSFLMLFSKGGRNELKINRKTAKVNNSLIKPFKDNLDGELVLFIVDEKCRGKGVGSTLEKMYCDFMIKNNARAQYLYTDTYSDFEFYERRGYKRLAGMEVDFEIEGQKEIPLPQYFLYVKEIEKAN